MIRKKCGSTLRVILQAYSFPVLYNGYRSVGRVPENISAFFLMHLNTTTSSIVIQCIFFLIFYNSLKGLLIAYYFSKEAYSIGIKWEKNFHIHFCLRDHTIWTRPLKPFVLFQVKPNCSVI